MIWHIQVHPLVFKTTDCKQPGNAGLHARRLVCHCAHTHYERRGDPPTEAQWENLRAWVSAHAVQLAQISWCMSDKRCPYQMRLQWGQKRDMYCNMGAFAVSTQAFPASANNRQVALSIVMSCISI